ncbi:hypothetical protein pb186bvf_020769 [Paramecium bursaria]
MFINFLQTDITAFVSVIQKQFKRDFIVNLRRFTLQQHMYIKSQTLFSGAKGRIEKFISQNICKNLWIVLQITMRIIGYFIDIQFQIQDQLIIQAYTIEILSQGLEVNQHKNKDEDQIIRVQRIYYFQEEFLYICLKIKVNPQQHKTYHITHYPKYVIQINFTEFNSLFWFQSQE